MGAVSMMPALLKTTSSRPKRSTAASTRRCGNDSSVRSPETVQLRSSPGQAPRGDRRAGAFTTIFIPARSSSERHAASDAAAMRR